MNIRFAKPEVTRHLGSAVCHLVIFALTPRDRQWTKHAAHRLCVFSRQSMERGLGWFAVSHPVLSDQLAYPESPLSGSPTFSSRPPSPSHLERSSERWRSPYPAEEYELSSNLEEWSRSAHRHRLRPHYRDGDTVDWWHEDASERERWKSLSSQKGIRRLTAPLMDVTKLWFVIIFTGICVGFAGGWLDILVMWCALSLLVSGTNLHMHVEGYLASGRVDADGDFCGIKSSAARAWSVCGLNSCHFCISTWEFS